MKRSSALRSLRSRRSGVVGLAVIVGTFPVLGGPTSAVQDGSSSKVVRLESLDVSDNVYLLRGGGTNILALIGETGVVLVDTLGPGWGAATRGALDNLTTTPVTTIINTHAHLGHTGGNGEFPSVVDIVAHENTKLRMARMVPFQGPGARFLPTRTFRDTLSLLDGFDRIELHHFGPAHTDGDIVVVFPEKGMAYLGDLFAGTRAPQIDRAAGGSGVGYPDVLARVRDQIEYFTTFERGPEIRTYDRIVPGHQDPPDQTPLLRWLTWADLDRHAAFTRDLVDMITASREAGGRTDDAVVAASMLANTYPGYTMEGIATAVDAIVDELEGTTVPGL